MKELADLFYGQGGEFSQGNHMDLSLDLMIQGKDHLSMGGGQDQDAIFEGNF
jgi:hypothetical protein